MPGPALTLVAWNCNHGSLDERMERCRGLRADVAFLQEWQPTSADSGRPNCSSFEVNKKKGIALVALNPDYALTPIDIDRSNAHSVIAAAVTGPASFNVIGIWAHPPHYAKDVLRSLASCESIIRSAPTVVMGDFNSGSKLKPGRLTRGHGAVVDALTKLGLESSYHAHHRTDAGKERHATYHHLRRPAEPWHIDFCFVPQDWLPRIQSVDVLAGPDWSETSDHFPLRVELKLS